MTLDETLQSLKTGHMQITLADKVVELNGSDAGTWLQGQITNDLNQLTEVAPLAACLCTPTGQLLTTLHIYRQATAFHIVTPQPEILLERVENYVIMEDVSASVIDRTLYSVQGKSSSGEYPRDRTGFGGYDTFQIPRHNEIPDDHLNALEIAAGIPRLGVDTNPKTLPPELGPAFEKEYISYTKGCYVGQEVLQRIHSRGHTNKEWMGLQTDSQLTGREIYFEETKVGEVSRFTEHPELGYIASATLKTIAATPGTQVQIEGVRAGVKAMPLLRN